MLHTEEPRLAGCGYTLHLPFANRRIPPFNSRRTHRILRSPRKSAEKRLRLYIAPPFNCRTSPLY
jgi:hypothetical protein